jgi:hypothetical protein
MGKHKNYKGVINDVIDSLLHPWIRRYPLLRFLDGMLHSFVEQNPEESFVKFLKYHAPGLIEELAKKRGIDA